MKLNALTPEQRAAVRMRFVARCQSSTLNLHPDLCIRVLNEYGCNVVEIEPETDTRQGVYEMSWPKPESRRTRYWSGLLVNLTERVLLDTAVQDAIFAADALAPTT